MLDGAEGYIVLKNISNNQNQYFSLLILVPPHFYCIKVSASNDKINTVLIHNNQFIIEKLLIVFESFIKINHKNKYNPNYRF